MSHQVVVTYDQEIVRKAIKYFWLRSFTIKEFVGDSFILALFIYNVVTGDKSWFLGFAGACVIGILTIRLGSYFVPLKQGLSRLEKMNSKTVTFHFTEGSLSAESDLGRWEVPWKLIEKIWKFPELWLLFPAQAGHFSLPVAELSDEIRLFITGQVQKHGGKIT